MTTTTHTAGMSAPPARCIYTGETLVPGDALLKSSHEHIIPLALGGSNQFTTDDVCADANSRAGDKIDKVVAGMLPFLCARHRYGLKGNRRTIPNVVFKGEFAEISGVPATLEIDVDGAVEATFDNEQHTKGKITSLATTEERVRFLLKARLTQADARGLNLLTPFGQIKDDEDVEVALMLADRTEAKTFKVSLAQIFDETAFHFALARLTIKIALGLGHAVFGPQWTFGPGTDLLRKGLWVQPGDAPPPIHGSLCDLAKLPFNRILNIGPDRHVMAVMPALKGCAAVIALFGGEAGVAVIDLGHDPGSFFHDFGDEARGGCAFEIPLADDVAQRRLVRKTFRQLANDAAGRRLI